MTAINNSAAAPLPIRRFWLAAKIALLLGTLSLAAAAAIAAPRIESRPIYLVTEDGKHIALEDGRGFLIAEDRQCRLVTPGKTVLGATPYITIPEAVTRHLPWER